MNNALIETLLRYIDQISSRDSNEPPHPLFKAITIAMAKVERGEQKESDGNFMVIANESDLSGSSPSLVIALVARAKNGKCEFVEIRDMTDNTLLQEEMIEKVIHSELLLDKYSSKNIPIEHFVHCLRDTGIRAELLKSE
ncbi:MAG: hypothetical protein WA941_06095, partial [Nitrososphaeraceae archaeon]